MKNYFFALMLSLSFLFNLSAQKQINYWFFGSKAGIDFNGVTPLAISGSLNTKESAAVMSDNSGGLLFYSNGVTVWDKTHSIMQNGTGLSGCPNFQEGSTSQGSIIVPHPGNDSIFYLFTLDCLENNFVSGLRYSMIYMNRNNGLGAIDPVFKNILLRDNMTEKMSAVQHCNGQDYWLISHERNNNNFLVYNITDSGINVNPVVSSIGAIHSYEIGQMKVSPDGRKLALANNTQRIVQLFDFDIITGVVINPINLPAYSEEYGIEFSPDNTKLYVNSASISTSVGDWIMQYDLSIGNDSISIASTEVQIFYSNKKGRQLGGMQLAPDERIYVANISGTALGVIVNPNEKGMAAEYQHNSFALAMGTTSGWSLPSFISTYFNSNIGQYICDKKEQEDLIEEDVFIPNVFNPNSDNSVFNVRVGGNVSDFLILVYDRHGQIVFSSNDPEITWNGNYQNTITANPGGVYLYRIELYRNGKQITQMGNVSLIR